MDFMRKIIAIIAGLLLLGSCDDPYKDQVFRAYDEQPVGEWLADQPEFSMWGRHAPEGQPVQCHESRQRTVHLLRGGQCRRGDLPAGEDQLRFGRRDAGRRDRLPAALPHHQRRQDGQREPDAETLAADPYGRLPHGRDQHRHPAAVYRQRRGQGAVVPRPPRTSTSRTASSIRWTSRWSR